ncbi:MAG: hypothetical protein KGJ66_03070 [Alphaproteobacteria bacterium]|nr:hypothetical protein [Alphaproteobacteria bacterium]
MSWIKISPVLVVVALAAVMAPLPISRAGETAAPVPPTAASAAQGDSIAKLLASLEAKPHLRMSHRSDGVNLADRCGATQYYCNAPTPTCCWSQSKGYYCATDVNHC